MISLALGVLLWSIAHLLPRLSPATSKSLGGKAGTAVMVLLAIALMIVGYRMADGTVYWGRTPMLTGLNNLLMLLAVYVFAAAGMKTALARKLPHLMLWGVLLWVLAHLLVNGDTPSFVLFGGIGLWALAQMAAISRVQKWTPPAAKAPKLELFAILGTVLVFGAIAAVHGLLGYPVFG